MMTTNTMKTANKAMRASFKKPRIHYYFTAVQKIPLSDSIFLCKEFIYEQCEFKFFSNN